MNRIALFLLATLGVAAVATAAFSPAASGSQSAWLRPQQSPVTFLKVVIGKLAANDYARAWTSLHPSHQQVAPEAEYVACERLSPVPGRLVSLVPLRVQRKQISVAGLEGTVSGTVVTFRMRLADRALGAAVTLKLSAAAVPVDGSWTWMLPRARYELYRDDACGL